jgi:hypothetical protein
VCCTCSCIGAPGCQPGMIGHHQALPAQHGEGNDVAYQSEWYKHRSGLCICFVSRRVTAEVNLKEEGSRKNDRTTLPCNSTVFTAGTHLTARFKGFRAESQAAVWSPSSGRQQQQQDGSFFQLSQGSPPQQPAAATKLQTR